MKNIVQLFLFIILSTPLYSIESIRADACYKASTHLIEVNPEWKLYVNEVHNQLNFCIDFKNDNARIQFHFEQVVSYLKLQTHNLNVLQLSKRNAMLDALLEYSDIGIFPSNANHQNRQPYFIDEENNYCAVAHLLKVDHQLEIIELIKQNKNNHFLKEMNLEALLQWGINNGFTENELALIQPGYPSYSMVWSEWGNGIGFNEGEVEVMKADSAESLLLIAGNFQTFDGESTSNIIGWDGQNYIHYNTGIEGHVHDVAFYDDSIYAAGELFFNDEKVNLLKWNGEFWSPCINQMNGIIYTAEIHDNKLFIGGDFNLINEEEYSNLAYYDFTSEQWSNDSNDGTTGAFSVNGIVRDIDLHFYFDSLVIAGDFTQTSNLSTSPNVNNDSCTHISVWLGDDWEHNYQGDFDPIYYIEFGYHHCVLGKGIDSKTGATRRVNDHQWESFIYPDFEQFYPNEDSLFHGILQNGNGLIWFYGSFGNPGFSSTVNLRQINQFGGSGSKGINSMDGSIHAMVEFQNNSYIAGNFTQIDGTPFNGLAKTNKTLPTKEIEELNLKINSSFNSIYVQGTLGQPSLFELYNESGQRVYKTTLQQNLQSQELILTEMNNGIYFYRMQIGQHIITDKVVLMNG